MARNQAIASGRPDFSIVSESESRRWASEGPAGLQHLRQLPESNPRANARIHPFSRRSGRPGAHPAHWWASVQHPSSRRVGSAAAARSVKVLLHINPAAKTCRCGPGFTTQATNSCCWLPGGCTRAPDHDLGERRADHGTGSLRRPGAFSIPFGSKGLGARFL